MNPEMSLILIIEVAMYFKTPLTPDSTFYGDNPCILSQRTITKRLNSLNQLKATFNIQLFLFQIISLRSRLARFLNSKYGTVITSFYSISSKCLVGYMHIQFFSHEASIFVNFESQ